MLRYFTRTGTYISFVLASLLFAVFIGLLTTCSRNFVRKELDPAANTMTQTETGYQPAVGNWCSWYKGPYAACECRFIHYWPVLLCLLIKALGSLYNGQGNYTLLGCLYIVKSLYNHPLPWATGAILRQNCMPLYRIFPTLLLIYYNLCETRCMLSYYNGGKPILPTLI